MDNYIGQKQRITPGDDRRNIKSQKLIPAKINSLKVVGAKEEIGMSKEPANFWDRVWFSEGKGLGFEQSSPQNKRNLPAL